MEKHPYAQGGPGGREDRTADLTDQNMRDECSSNERIKEDWESLTEHLESMNIDP